MAQPKTSDPKNLQSHVMTRWQRWRLVLNRGGKVRAIATYPEPKAIGDYVRGRQLMAGNFHFYGNLVEAPGQNIWDITPPNDDFNLLLHRFGWLDDLAAIGEDSANRLAKSWVEAWVDRYGSGQGLGWGPATTGRRLIHMLSHSPIVLNGMDRTAQTAYFRCVSRQASYLARSWTQASRGLPRVEALCGLIYAGLSLEGLETMRRSATEALAECLSEDIDNEGGLPNRNPEDLLEVFMLLGWVMSVLQDIGEPFPDALQAALLRITPTLRALRQADGGLARFHGGGRGLPGQLDKALVTSQVRLPATTGQAMGFATLAHGRTSLVIDAACPPKGRLSGYAHASTLAFEMCAGQQQLIVNCGSGRPFGQDWEQACRATASHSTLSLEAYSSSRIGKPVRMGARVIRPIVQSPKRVIQQKSIDRKNSAIMLSHDGYAPSIGLTHLRRLVLSGDGHTLDGEDSLRALSRKDKLVFDKRFDATNLNGLPFQVRFHLHPEVDAQIDMGGRAISLSLRTGEVWIFTCPQSPLSLEPSVYMDPLRLKPRSTKQIVLTGLAMSYAHTLTWRLVKAQDASLRS